MAAGAISTDVDTGSIRDGVAAHGLVGFVLAHSDLDEDNEAALDAMAAAVEAGASLVASEEDAATLQALARGRFFNLQAVITALIPRLRVGHRELLRLVYILVEAAGRDGAAGLPNVALRDWCAQDRTRSEAILAEAAGGDALAIRYLPFALEAARMIDEALEQSTSRDRSARNAAVTALSRMDVEQVDASRAMSRLAEIAQNDPDEDVATAALLGGFDFLKRHPEVAREALFRALMVRTEAPTPAVVDTCAALLAFHGDAAPEPEVHRLLETVRLASPEQTGAINSLDHAAYAMVSAGRLHLVSEAIRDLIDRHNGQTSLKAFSTFTYRVQEGGTEVIGSVMIDWLQRGGVAARDEANRLIPIGSGAAPGFAVAPEALPSNPGDQLLLVRRAVGYLFITPASAAVIPLAVLRSGDSTIANAVLDILYHPLLLSYGSLRAVLSAEADAGHPRAEALRQLIGRVEAIHAAAEATSSLAELRPSEAHREIERVRWHDQMERSVQAAHASSIFSEIATVQYLLYGRRSATYMRDIDSDELRSTELNMASHSVKMELPRLTVLDPAGLHFTLLQLRHGRLMS